MPECQPHLLLRTHLLSCNYSQGQRRYTQRPLSSLPFDCSRCPIVFPIITLTPVVLWGYSSLAEGTDGVQQLLQSWASGYCALLSQCFHMYLLVKSLPGSFWSVTKSLMSSPLMESGQVISTRRMKTALTTLLKG